MKKVILRVDMEIYTRFMEAHEFFLEKYYFYGGGPGLFEFIQLCAQAACNDVLVEKRLEQGDL